MHRRGYLQIHSRGYLQIHSKEYIRMHNSGYLQIHLRIYLQIHGRIFTDPGYRRKSEKIYLTHIIPDIMGVCRNILFCKKVLF